MAKSHNSQENDSHVLEGKIFAILSYLFVLCIIPLVLKKENKFVLFHGKQGLVLFVAEVTIFILHIVLGQWILKLGTFGLGVFSLTGIIAVLCGQYLKLPVVADIAEKITL